MFSWLTIFHGWIFSNMLSWHPVFHDIRKKYFMSSHFPWYSQISFHYISFCRWKQHPSSSVWVKITSHYNDIIMGTVLSQISSLTIVYSTFDSDPDERKHQSSTSLTFVLGIHGGLMNSPHKWPLTWKMFRFDDIIMPHNGVVQCSEPSSIFFLTHQPLAYVAAISKVDVSNSLHRVVALALAVKLLADEYHRSSRMRSQNWFRASIH